MLFGALGLAASTAAAWVHYNLIVDPAYTSICDINATVSCKQAYLSRYGSVAGVPVAVGGVIFFALVLLLVWAGRKRSPAADSIPGHLLWLSTIGLAVVLYLAYASFFILKEVCPLCVTTYVAVLGVLAVALRTNVLPIGQLPGRAARDIRTLVSRPMAAGVALLFLGAAAALILLFPRPQETAAVARAPLVPLTEEQRAEFQRWWDVQTKLTVPYATEGAKVLVVKFNDYQCPPCKSTYEGYEPILAKYKPSEVKYLMKHYPIDPKCNVGVTNLLHPAACDAAAAAEMARPKGTFDTLTAWFFAHQDELSPATVRRGAKEAGGIDNFDAEYATAIAIVKADAAAGKALEVGGTPTFFINGTPVRSILPPQYFEAAIEFELKRAK